MTSDFQKLHFPKCQEIFSLKNCLPVGLCYHISIKLHVFVDNTCLSEQVECSSKTFCSLMIFLFTWNFYCSFFRAFVFFVESIKTRTWSFPCAYKISKCPYIIRYCRTRQEVKTSHCGYVYTSFQYKANRTFNRMKQNPLSMTKREVWTYIRGNRQRPVKRALKINRHRKSYKIFALRQ